MMNNSTIFNDIPKINDYGKPIKIKGNLQWELYHKNELKEYNLNEKIKFKNCERQIGQIFFENQTENGRFYNYLFGKLEFNKLWEIVKSIYIKKDFKFQISKVDIIFIQITSEMVLELMLYSVEI